MLMETAELDTIAGEKKSYRDFIRFCVNSYIEQNPDESQSEMARACGISKSTLNRIYNQDHTLNVDKCMKIVSVISNKQEAINFLKKVNKDYANKLSSLFSVQIEKCNNADIYSNFKNEEIFLTYALSCMGNGTTKNEILEILGTKGLIQIDELISQGLIREENGYYIGNSASRRHILPTEQIPKISRFLTNYYKLNHKALERNYINFGIKRLNKKGLSEIRKIHEELYNKIYDIYDDESNHGDIPVFSTSMMDTFTVDPSLLIDFKEALK